GALPAAEGARGRGDPAARLRPGGAGGSGAAGGLAGSARRHGGEPPRREERGQAGSARDLRAQAAPGQGAGASRRAPRRAAHLEGDRRQDEKGVRRAPARARAARADAPDPEGAGRGRGGGGRGCRAEEGDRRRRHAGGRAQARRQGAEAPAADGGEQRRVLDAADLPGMARGAAVARRAAQAHRYRGSAQGARRGPLRPREDQAPHPRVPRGEEAQPERQEPDPVLRRAAWGDRKSTRLNSSHVSISYAVFCLKKKKKNKSRQQLYLVQQLSKI